MVAQTANSEESQVMVYTMNGVDLGAWAIDVWLAIAQTMTWVCLPAAHRFGKQVKEHLEE
jgi:hypothetical protein